MRLVKKPSVMLIPMFLAIININSAYADNQSPSVVTGIQAIATSDSNIQITWQSPQDNVGVVGFNVYKDNNYYATIYNSLSYTDQNVSVNQTHRYQIVAFDEARNYSTLSNAVSAAVQSDSNESAPPPPSNDATTTSSKPDAPTGLTALASGATQVDLSWNAPSGGAEGYNIYLDDRYSTTVKGQANYTVQGLTSGQTYQFEVVAFRNNKWSTKSSPVQVQTNGDQQDANQSQEPSNPDNGSDSDVSDSQSPPAANNVSNSSGKPDAPTGLRGLASGSSRVDLDWNAPSGGAEGYDIYRDGSYISTVKGGENYTVQGLTSGQNYQFEVVAFRNNQWSTKSTPVQVRTSGAQEDADQNQEAPPPANNNSSVPAGYNLVFSEEFNSGSIDSSKWSTRYLWGPNLIINNEEQYYVDSLNDPNFGHNPFRLDGSTLTISASRTPDGLREKARNQPYLSGAMTTYNKFRMKYGYVEMRAQLPNGRGLWPAFWLLHDVSNGNRPEIDVVEMLGHDTQVIYQTYHYFDNNGSLRSTPSFTVSESDYANDYHTYGMKWEPGSIKWYVDGRETNSYNSSTVSSEDMYILINLALGGSWAGSPDGSTPFPASFKIDYIRAYQK